MERVKQVSYVLLLSFVLLIASVPVVGAESTTTPKQMVQHITELAVKYRTMNSETFGTNSTLDEVIASWGEPEDLSTVSANYWSHHIRFNYHQYTLNRDIYAVEDFGPNLSMIKLADVVDNPQVEELLGEPISEEEQEGNLYVKYQVNSDLRMTFIFQSAFSNPNPELEMYTINASDDPYYY